MKISMKVDRIGISNQMYIWGLPFSCDLRKMNGAYEITASHTLLLYEFFSHLHLHNFAIEFSATPHFLHHHNGISKQSSQFNMIMVEKAENLAANLHC